MLGQRERQDIVGQKMLEWSALKGLCHEMNMLFEGLW